MTDFNFKALDKEGQSTLQVIAEANRFNEWMYQTIKPFCNGSILEIGSGIGNISSYFINDGEKITLSDIRKNYCEYLEQQFGESQNVEEIIQLNLVADDFAGIYKKYEGCFDTVFALNVVEHIEDDNKAIENCRFLLKPGGNLIILVPAYMWLYNGFDKALEHFRRYNKPSLNQLLVNNKFDIKHNQYFNFAGILGWYVSGKLQKNETIPGGQMKLYNTLVPVFKLVDKLTLQKIGLSVISVGRK